MKFTRGDIVRVVPKDEDDPDAVEHKDKTFTILREAYGLTGIHFIYVSLDGVHTFRVFREQDLELVK